MLKKSLLICSKNIRKKNRKRRELLGLENGGEGGVCGGGRGGEVGSWERREVRNGIIREIERLNS